LEVLINTLVVFIGATAVRWGSIVTGREIFILKGSCQNGSRLHRHVSTSQAKGHSNTNVVCHLIFSFDALRAEKVLEWLLLLTA
jgi:hypothetical protein